MKQFLIILSAILFLGCNTYQKQLAKFNTFADTYTGELAKKCVQHFPVKDSIGSTTQDLKKADNKNYQSQIDSLQELANFFKDQVSKDTASTNPCAAVAKNYQNQVATLNGKIADLKKSYKPCKPDTIQITTTVYRKDEAALTVCANNFNKLRDSLNIVKHDLANSKSQSSSRLKYLLILAAIVGVATVLKVTGKI